MKRFTYIQEYLVPIISWKAAKVLDILPQHYPYPPKWKHNHTSTSTENVIETTQQQHPPQHAGYFNSIPQCLLGKCSYGAEEAKPFCAEAPWLVPFAYEKKAENRIGIAPTAEYHCTSRPRCAPIVVTPTKAQTAYACALTYHD